MLVTPFPMVTEVKVVHPSNADDAIVPAVM